MQSELGSLFDVNGPRCLHSIYSLLDCNLIARCQIAHKLTKECGQHLSGVKYERYVPYFGNFGVKAESISKFGQLRIYWIFNGNKQ